MRPEFRSQRKSWGESIEWQYDLPEIGGEKRPRGLRSGTWFTLGLIAGPVLAGVAMALIG